MIRNKKIIFGIIIAILISAISLIVWQNCHRPVIITETPESSTEEMVGNLVLYANGRWGAIYEGDEKGKRIASLLIRKLHGLNLQAKCIISEEDLQGMKEENKILELVFKRPVDITVSQWIDPEDRSYIPVDENGYRILEDAGDVLFVLKDNSGRGLEANILIGYGTAIRTGYGCWAIKQKGSDELDKTWIEEIETLLLE
ncbi:MAG: hypothetical protein ABIG29_00940 [Candidatus Nealsonbacteria bacterium]